MAFKEMWKQLRKDEVKYRERVEKTTGRKNGRYGKLAPKLSEYNRRQKGRTFEERYGTERAIKIKEKIIKHTLARLFQRPTSYERRVVSLIKKYQLPYRYVGDGKVIIGGKNPDFINTNHQKIFIEVYAKQHLGYLKPLNYEDSRGGFFDKYEYKTVFLSDDDLFCSNWEKVCLRKIGGSI